MSLFSRGCRHTNLKWAAPQLVQVNHIDLWTGKVNHTTQEHYQIGTCADCGYAKERKIK